MKVIKYIAMILGVYIFLWTVAYAVLMKFDFKYYFNYLWLSWTGPGEMPAYIQISAVILTILVALAFTLWKFLTKQGTA